MATWSEEGTLKLINIMKQFPVLWQSDRKFYGKKVDPKVAIISRRI